VNPALNTVPYAFILVAGFKALSKGAKGVKLEEVWDKAAAFLTQFDPRQIRYVGEQFLLIVEFVATGARRSRQVTPLSNRSKNHFC
jgi:COP9 signalosome complex subunit 3